MPYNKHFQIFLAVLEFLVYLIVAQSFVYLGQGSYVLFVGISIWFFVQDK